MILARVEGTVWGARQSEGLAGRRLVEVRRVGLGAARDGTALRADCDDAHLQRGTLVAVDGLGADVGQLVLVAVGSRVRDLVAGPHAATKACVVAIVDEASVESSCGEGGP